MRRPIPKYLSVCVVVSLLGIGHAAGQCQPEVRYSLEKKSENSYSIFLKSETATPLIKIELYDLLKGKVLEEKAVNSLNAISQEVFKNIPPSKYAIIIRVDHCDKPVTLGGINGISIGIPD